LNKINNKEDRYSRKARLSDTRHSAKETKGGWRYYRDNRVFNAPPTRDLNM